jgi:hypothetical protein
MSRRSRFDVVFDGASRFTGRPVAERLARAYGIGGDLAEAVTRAVS